MAFLGLGDILAFLVCKCFKFSKDVDGIFKMFFGIFRFLGILRISGRAVCVTTDVS